MWHQGSYDVLPILLDAAVKGTVVLLLAWILALSMKRHSAARRHAVWLTAMGCLLSLPLLSAALPSLHVLPSWCDLTMATAPEEPVPSTERVEETGSSPPRPVEKPDLAAPSPRTAENPPIDSHIASQPANPATDWPAVEPPITTAPPDVLSELPPAAAPGTSDSNTPEASRPDAPDASAVATKTRAGRNMLSQLIPWFAAVWLAGLVTLAGRLLLATMSTWWVASKAKRCEDASCLDLLQETAATLGLRRTVTLIESDRCSIPLVLGMLRPRLILPPEFCGWPDDRRRVVVLHELAHIMRWDCLTKLFAQLVCAVHWFNPLVWFAYRRTLIEAEQACDDVVLGRGSDPHDYAEHLLKIASGPRTRRLAAVTGFAMARPSSLEGRLLAIVDSGRSRRGLTVLGVLALIGLLAGVTAVIAPMRADDGPEPYIISEWGGGTPDRDFDHVLSVRRRDSGEHLWSLVFRNRGYSMGNDRQSCVVGDIDVSIPDPSGKVYVLTQGGDLAETELSFADLEEIRTHKPRFYDHPLWKSQIVPLLEREEKASTVDPDETTEVAVSQKGTADNIDGDRNWSKPVKGLRGCLVPRWKHGDLQVDILLQNVGLKELLIPRCGPDSMHFYRRCGLPLELQLHGQHPSISLDTTAVPPIGVNLLQHILAGSEGNDSPVTTLKPKETYTATHRVGKTLGGGVTLALPRLEDSQAETIGATYDSIGCASEIYRMAGKMTWHGELNLPAVPLREPPPQDPDAGNATLNEPDDDSVNASGDSEPAPSERIMICYRCRVVAEEDIPGEEDTRVKDEVGDWFFVETNLGTPCRTPLTVGNVRVATIDATPVQNSDGRPRLEDVSIGCQLSDLNTWLGDLDKYVSAVQSNGIVTTERSSWESDLTTATTPNASTPPHWVAVRSHEHKNKSNGYQGKVVVWLDARVVSRATNGKDRARPIPVDDLKEAAANVRAEHPDGGRAMWEALAALVKPGMTVAQMKVVLPPAAPKTDDDPREAVVFDGASFTIWYPLDTEFGVEAAGIAKGKGPDQMVLSAAPQIKKLADIPSVRVQTDESLNVVGPERDATADLPWGEAVRGVRVRLRADKTTWSTREVPVVKVDAQNNGEEEFHLTGWMTSHCYAHIDDVTYLGTAAVTGGLRPKDTFMAVPVKLTGSPQVAGSFRRVPVRTNPDEGRLELKPGIHVVRISFRMVPRGAPEGSPHVEAFSNPLEIEIVSDQDGQPARSDTPEIHVPEHLRHWPGLADRVGGKIVDAPAEDVKVAKGYVTFADKGKVHNGRRVTIMTAKPRYAVGEEVRVIHVLEAAEPGDKVYVMGPKTVFGEYVDGKDVTKGIPKPHRYDGRVLDSPAVDFNYAITKYTFDEPGEHTIQWRAAGPFDGEGLVSNVLKIGVVQGGEAGGAPGHAKQSRADTVLPGSRLSIEEAVGRWAAFAVACDAVADPNDESTAHLVPGSTVKWQRYRWGVSLRDRRGPSEPSLIYRVWTLQDGPERPVANGERVIWIGVNPNPGNYRGIKALPDTPENREAVRAAFAKRPPSADRYVAFPEHADAEQAAERVALLKRNLDTFRFVFRAALESEQPRRFIALRVAEGKDSSGWEKPAIRITREQATRIIDHLAAEGLFFRRAANFLEHAAFEPSTAGHTIWLIDDENNPKAILVDQIQFGKDERITALRDVLEGPARDAADALLQSLKSNRQGEQATALGPSAAARKLAGSLPAGWRLTKSGRCDAPAEWSGKTDCEYLTFAHDALELDADGLPRATLALWFTPRNYAGRRLPTMADQPGGALLYGQSRSHLLLFEVSPLAQPHWMKVEAAFQQCGFARLDERGVTPAARLLPALDLDKTMALLVQKVGGEWRKDRHNLIHHSKYVLRGRFYAEPDRKLSAQYTVFGFGSTSRQWQEWLREAYREVKGSRIIGHNLQCTVQELTSDPVAAARYRQAIIDVLRLRPLETDSGYVGGRADPTAQPDTPENHVAIQTVTGPAKADLKRAFPGSRAEPATNAPFDDRERLRVSFSPMKLLASDVKYDGRALQGTPRRSPGEEVLVGNVVYYRAIIESGLIAEDLAAKTATAYRPFDLAIAAGWYKRKDDEYLPQGINGLYRQGDRLWMGTQGVGVLVYDTRTKTWSRYSTEETPVPGHHHSVLYADADYVFVNYGAALDVYSATNERWLHIVAVPTRDALRLGTSEGLPLPVARGWDHRRYADQPYIPIGGRETPSLASMDKITRRPDGSYLLHSGHPDTESAWTDLVVRKEDLEAAFAHAGPPARGKAAASWEIDVANKALSLYQSDVSLAEVMEADEAIQPGDSKQEVIDLFGQPREQHKSEHVWSYFFAYGTPHADNTPMATVTVWLDGDVVRQVKVWFRPARDVVESAKERLKPGTTAGEVLRQFGSPQEQEGDRWHYRWEYDGGTEFQMDVTFADDQTVSDVEIRSGVIEDE